MRVAAELQRSAGVAQPACRADAVGEIAFGGRAEATRAAGTAKQADVAVGEVRGMHRREAGSQRAGISEHLGGSAAVGCPALLVLGGLLAEVGVQHHAARSG